MRNKRWDDWVPQDRVRKFTDENKELAAQLHNQMKMLQSKAPKSVGKGQGKRGANGSDFSSARGSEERGSVAAAPGRGGPRRNRDYDLEHVSTFVFLDVMFAAIWVWPLQRNYFACNWGLLILLLLGGLERNPRRHGR